VKQKKYFFLENYSEALKILEKNIKFLKNTNNYEIIKNDCFNFLKSNKSIDLKFDIIFIDPPFKELRINEIIEKIIEKKFLNREGILIVHRHKNDKVELTKKMNIFEERFYGISKISFGN
jgi:16S rRNA (guanine966-N2)-methyltransferase